MRDIELPGAFYLGRVRDVASGKTSDEPLLLDARDLTTHAVCIGMTGSGKTGLCLAMMEEAAIDGVPVIAIDPKGDIADLALAFPGLTASEFRPWIDEDEARRLGKTPDEHASAVAQRWSAGLAAWGEDAARVRRFRDSCEVAIYTPGDRAGIPLSPLASLDPPPEEQRADAGALAERAGTTAASILALLDDDADALSPSHILLVAILTSAWRNGRALDIGALVAAIQTPPVSRLGVMELESVFPAKERFAFAMRLNALLASPAYEGWLSGEPLDVARLLYAPSGKPRISIISIAHLDDRQRMAVVALLFGRIVDWMRTQPGTASLRALVYMDEIAGYAPPVANPPSKPPLMTLLKQARAFGVGMVLATQNPADLDYKALGNVGAWFVGRLQTDRDRAKVLDGIAAGSSGPALDRAATEQALASLGNRVFLLHDVHAAAPLVFETRWTLSYLAGPLTRPQLARLRSGRAEVASVRPSQERASVRGRPQLPPDVQQCVLPGASAAATYRPAILGSARIAYTAAGGDDVIQDVTLVAELGALGPDWTQAREIAVASLESLLATVPVPGASWAELPAAATQAKSYVVWKRTLADELGRSRTLTAWRSGALASRSGESEESFRARVALATREARDGGAEKLRARYAPKLAALQERLRKAEQAQQRESQQAGDARVQAVVGFGVTLLGAFLGRKAFSASTISRAGTAARGAGRAMREGQDVARATETVAAVRALLDALDAEFKTAVAALDAPAPPVESTALKAKRGGVDVRLVALAWIPETAES